MFAAIALVCFILALFEVPAGFDLTVLGLVFLALQAAVSWIPWRRDQP